MPDMKTGNSDNLNAATDLNPSGSSSSGGSFFALLLPLVFIFLHLILQSFVALMLANQGLNWDQSLFSALADPVSSQTLQEALAQPDLMAKTSLLTGLILLPILAFFIWRRSKRNPRIFLHKRTDAHTVGRVLLLSFSAQGLAYVWLMLLDLLARQFDFISLRLAHYVELMEKLGGQAVSPLLLISSSALMVPLIEELIYRAISMGEYSRALSRKTTILTQAFIFGLVHGNLVQAVYAFILGLVIGYIYWESENFYLAFLAHAFFNFLGGVLPQWFLPNSPVIVALRILQILMFLILLAQHFREARSHDQGF
ncbi:MAG: CPBP family intramembrane metalloprotease [Eubacteriales bacterium]|nr:CPBP family intramembrane metalloprotease [Eubacteriales bacterium]